MGYPLTKLCCTALALGLAYAAEAATLVHNVRGYTMNQGEVIHFAGLEFDQGVVTRLYSDPQEAATSGATQRIDGAGAILLPGLIDAHGHVKSLGIALATVSLVGMTSEQAAADRVAQHLAGSASGWVFGRGWNQVLWPGKAFPTRRSLDALSRQAAIVLTRVDGHSMWVNSEALRRAGITRDTPDPEGGQITRDATGEATGLLIDNAMELVNAVVPTETLEQIKGHLLRSLQNLAASGVTSVHDARASALDIEAYRALRAGGRLPVRVYPMLDVRDPAIDQLLAAGPAIDPSHMLDIRSVKISADGALGSRGAALLTDYRDAPGNRGLLLFSAPQLDHHMERSVAAGFQVNTHAIGDRANDEVLTRYERLNRAPASRELRHRVEHAQVLRPTDIARFGKAGIIASIQPTHATSDKNMAVDRLGEARLNGAYAWRSLLDSGARLAGGSDFPVESNNPFYGLHAAVTRQSHDNAPVGGWLPGEKLTRAESLSLFTEDAAYAAHQESDLGRLLPGYQADFILVRDDYFAVPEQDIWKNRVFATYVAGRRVYPAPGTP